MIRIDNVIINYDDIQNLTDKYFEFKSRLLYKLNQLDINYNDLNNIIIYLSMRDVNNILQGLKIANRYVRLW